MGILNKSQNPQGLELTNEDILKLTCDNINITMFGFDSGAFPSTFPKYVNNQELYISDDRDILYLQLYGFNKIMSIIFDFRELLQILQETQPSIMPLQVKPSITISYCNLYKTLPSCEGDCEKCLII